MNNALAAPATNGALSTTVLSAEQMALVKRTVFPGSTNDELALYVHDCNRQGVSPLDRLIHPTVRTDKRGNRKYTPITSIDLMRSRAEATGEYAGNDEPVFKGNVKSDDFTASVTVWKMVAGQRCPFTATARWTEYKPSEDFMWNRMPHLMLGKVAEALALRKAFPRNLSGLYAKEEMDQASAPIRTGPVRDAEPDFGELPSADDVADQTAPAGFDRQAVIERIKRYVNQGGGRAHVAAVAKAQGLAGKKLTECTDAELERMNDTLQSGDGQPADAGADDVPFA